MKTTVTHFSPDLDAMTSIWLIKKFLPDWKDAQIKFAPAGKTLNNASPDEDPDIIHVDTGLGRFDHHQSNEKTCAAQKVLHHLLSQNHIHIHLQEPLNRLVNFVIEDDHFLEVYYPDPNSDRYEFLLNNLISGLKVVLAKDEKLIEYVFVLLDASLELLKSKGKAELEIKKGFIFHSYLGKSLAIETSVDAVLKVAQKQGFNLVIRKDPKFGNFRIKAPPDAKLDLTSLCEKILERDSVGVWFLHSSKHMLLNGSPKRPDQTPSPLTLNQVIEIARNI